MSTKEQTTARYVIQFLLEDGKTMLQIARATGMQRSRLESFYRGIYGHELTPQEVGKLEKLHNKAGKV